MDIFICNTNGIRDECVYSNVTPCHHLQIMNHFIFDYQGRKGRKRKQYTSEKSKAKKERKKERKKLCFGFFIFPTVNIYGYVPFLINTFDPIVRVDTFAK